jgi:hypothetical protein
VIISFIHGGLGNQMFQYAMGRRLAHAHGVELKLDLTNYGGTTDRPTELQAFTRKFRLDELCMIATPASKAEIARLKDRYGDSGSISRLVRRLRKVRPNLFWPKTDVRESQYRFDPALLYPGGDAYLFGIWQSPKYFAGAEDVIRADFRPKDPAIAAYADDYVNRLRTLGGPVVSLHVRRGDMAYAIERLRRDDLVHGPPVGTDYLQSAMSRFGSECRFLVFSDSPPDIDWCRQNIRASRLHFSEGHSDIQDLSIMSACDHNIVANSTFSWWAAWLNQRPGRRVVSPKQWASDNSPRPMPTDDLIPDGWETI